MDPVAWAFVIVVMSSINDRPIVTVTYRPFPSEEVCDQAGVKLIASWEEELRKPGWEDASLEFRCIPSIRGPGHNDEQGPPS